MIEPWATPADDGDCLHCEGELRCNGEGDYWYADSGDLPCPPGTQPAPPDPV
jgi:hypothetical protein